MDKPVVYLLCVISSLVCLYVFQRFLLEEEKNTETRTNIPEKKLRTKNNPLVYPQPMK